MPKFIDDHDAARMLNNSIISLEGRLIFVQQVIDKKLFGADIETGEQMYAPADFDKIRNPCDGRLGYLNSRGGCAYIVRIPARITTMGLCRSNLKLIAQHSGMERRASTELGPALFKSVYNTYHDIYPTFEEAFSRVLEKGIPTAFDRSFAIDREGTILYKGRAIGTANARGEEFSALTDAGKDVMRVRKIPKLKWREV